MAIRVVRLGPFLQAIAKILTLSKVVRFGPSQQLGLDAIIYPFDTENAK